jgi:hypothetical protein
MADKSKLEQMLESLVNDDQAKAEELFHEYVVEASREIYESLIESEMADDEDDEEVDEAADTEADEDDEEVEEGFEDIAIEADDEMGGDPTDDLEGDLDAEMGDDEMGDEEGGSEADLFQDLEAIVDELQAKFDELKGEEGGEMGDEMGDDEGGFGDEQDVKDNFDLATVREYVEKVSDGHGAEKKGKGETADGSASGLKFSKNDMGGTTANILSGRDGATGGEAGAAGGALKGKPLSDTKAKEDNAGNINVPGAKNGSAFNKKEPGHGAEKKGAAEKGADTASLFRGRR